MALENTGRQSVVLPGRSSQVISNRVSMAQMPVQQAPIIQQAPVLTSNLASSRIINQAPVVRQAPLQASQVIRQPVQSSYVQQAPAIQSSYVH